MTPVARVLCPFCDAVIAEGRNLDHAVVEVACDRHLAERHPIRCRVNWRVRRAVKASRAIREAR